MGADWSRTRPIAGLFFAGLLLVVGSSAWAADSKHKLGSSCVHPLMSTAFGGTGARYYSVAFLPDSPSVGQDQLDVSIHNPRVVICRAVVEERAGTYNPKALRTFYPTIGRHGGLSSPVPRPGEGADTVLFAKVYARLEPPKSGTHPASGCTLDTIWDGVGDGGDKQDYSVTLKVTGHEPGPYSVQVEVEILNPKVEICSGTVLWYEGNGATGQHSAPVTIGVHGGVSSRVSLPASADGVAAKVLGRLK
jgi:hypothetical protein